jgi:hypothetical protein
LEKGITKPFSFAATSFYIDYYIFQMDHVFRELDHLLPNVFNNLFLMLFIYFLVLAD